MPRQVLGRGLGALLNNQTTDSETETGEENKVTSSLGNRDETAGAETAMMQEVPGDAVMKVKIESIVPSPLQPRKEFSDESLKELSDSIKERGILQPLIVRPSKESGQLELIAGERRLRASKMAGLTELPVLIRPSEDRSALEWMLVENLQREDLNPLDEAMGYRELAQSFKLKQEEIAKKVGKSRAAVSNAMRLLKLPETTQDYLKLGEISVGHAKVLLGVGSADLVEKATKKVIDGQLSVRQLEEWVAKLTGERGSPVLPSTQSRKELPPEIADIEDKIRDLFATKVSVKYKDQKGSIEIKFFNHDDLDRIVEILKLEKER